MKTIQYFSDDYLEATKKSTPTQIADFLDDYIRLHTKARPKPPTMKLISLRIPADLLQAIKKKAARQNLPYQSLIKKILADGVN